MFNIYIPNQIRLYMSMLHVILYGYRHTFFFNFIKNVNSEKHKEDVNSYNGWICSGATRGWSVYFGGG